MSHDFYAPTDIDKQRDRLRPNLTRHGDYVWMAYTQQWAYSPRKKVQDITVGEAFVYGLGFVVSAVFVVGVLVALSAL